ncbi:hypothetical protein D3C72_1880090 [compost metagenome]
MTTTSSPECSLARCTCPMEAAERGVAVKAAKASSGAQPSSLASMARATSGEKAGTLSWRDSSSRT